MAAAGEINCGCRDGSTRPNAPRVRGAGPVRKTFVRLKTWTAPHPLQPIVRPLVWTGTDALALLVLCGCFDGFLGVCQLGLQLLYERENEIVDLANRGKGSR